MSYCNVVANMERDNVHVEYHDHEYGFPIDDDNELFARLVLEINQAGLSWTTILNKKQNVKKKNFFQDIFNYLLNLISISLIKYYI